MGSERLSWPDVVRSAMLGHRRHAVQVPGRRGAAVLILLFERDDEPWIVLTKRTDTVRHHKGEISFPGGAHDEDDPDLWATAVRETVEELGVEANALRQLGILDDFPTFSSGYVVTPFVGLLEPVSAWRHAADEVAEVIELPLRRLEEFHRREYWERHGARRPMHIFEAGGHYVWGLTAFILRGFLDLVGPALEAADARS